MTTDQPTNDNLSGAQQLVAELVDAGINTLFSLSGNQIMPIYDACLDYKVRIVHTRHEGSAVFMAEAWSQLTGQPGIALVTAAPGFANALGALYSAKMSNTPVLLLAGDSPIKLDGAGAFQEFPQMQAVEPFVKTTERVMTSSQIRSTIRRAISTATEGIPGPVHLALPFDILNDRQATEQSTSQTPATDAAGRSGSESNDAKGVQSLLRLIEQAKRPLVLTGPQLSQTRKGIWVNTLSDTLNVPLLCIESPRGLKDPSLGTLSEVLGTADLVVYLGKDINFQTRFADNTIMPGAHVALIHPSDNHINTMKNRLGERLELSVCTSIEPFCEQLIAKVTPQAQRTDWFKTVGQAHENRQLDSQSQAELDSARSKSSGNNLHANDIAQTVNRFLSEYRNTVLVCDGGEFGQWSQAFAQSDKRVINGASGAIGGSIAQAIAASLAEPEALVIAMLGDGTAGFYLAEFETAAREQTNPIFIIGNDSRWNAEHHIQQRDFGPDRTYACELSKDTNYAECAVALGIHGLSANSPESFEAVLSEAIAIAINNHRPVCINALMHGAPAPGYQNTAAN